MFDYVCSCKVTVLQYLISNVRQSGLVTVHFCGAQVQTYLRVQVTSTHSVPGKSFPSFLVTMSPWRKARGWYTRHLITVSTTSRMQSSTALTWKSALWTSKATSHQQLGTGSEAWRCWERAPRLSWTCWATGSCMLGATCIATPTTGAASDPSSSGPRDSGSSTLTTTYGSERW